MKKLFKNHTLKYLAAIVLVLGISLAAVPNTGSGNPGSVLAQGWVGVSRHWHYCDRKNSEEICDPQAPLADHTRDGAHF